MHAPNPDRGLSPIVGTVTLLVITVLLAATVAAGLFGLADSALALEDPLETTDTDDDAPSATFDLEKNGPYTIVTHAGSDDLDGSQLEIETDSGTEPWGDRTVSAGDETMVPGDVERVSYDGEEMEVSS
ncbi:type IV pilin [Natrialbaceae archaeon GCM10025810]